MKPNFMQSLQSTTLIKIATTLWNQRDIRTLMKYYAASQIYWSRVENEVVEKIRHLPIPNIFKEKILILVKVLSIQIQNFAECHDDDGLTCTLYFTDQGALDKKKTIESVVRNDDVDIYIRYRLACNYCLEDDLIGLWDKMDENCQEECVSSILQDPEEYDLFLTNEAAVGFWTHKLVKVTGSGSRFDLQDLEDPGYVIGFKIASNFGNRVALEYFLNKLTPQEREQQLAVQTSALILEHCLDFETQQINLYQLNRYGEALCFLMSEMNSMELGEMIKRWGCADVLKCFLIWPWQNLFVEIAHRIMYFKPSSYVLSIDHFYSVLRSVVDNIVRQNERYRYLEVFVDFWNRYPDTALTYLKKE